MSKGIFRYVLKEKTDNRGYQEKFIIDMPKASKVLCTAIVNDQILVWVEADTTSEPAKRVFLLYQDEMMLPSCPGEYVGTVAAPNAFFHVYECGLL